MPNTLFISYKSEENPFALKLAAGLKNRGINVWIDRMDIHPGDDWDEALDHALKHLCRGMIVILTPDYLKSRVCHDEWSYALEKHLPVIPVLLRRLNDDEIHFRLRRIQRLDFLDWLDDKAYQAKFELLVERIQRDQSDSIGDIPSAEIQYLTSLIADLESQQGVENYITLSAQSEIVRVDHRPRKIVPPEFLLVLKPSTPEHDSHPETKKIENIQQAVADHAKFVLIGDPGAGKTTTLRRLALEMAQARLEGLKAGDRTHPLPFLVYLPRWSTEPTAADFIRRQWAQTDLGGDVLRELHSGNIRLYLDGLNEMGGEGKNKAVLLREWLQSADGPRHVMITCRQADYHDDLDLKLPTVLVEPLTDEKIREFAAQYLESEKLDHFLNQIFFVPELNLVKREDRSLVLLARLPYMLAVLIFIYEYNGDLPRNDGALFKKLVMVLWERERLHNTYGWIPPDEANLALGSLAFSMIDERQSVQVPLDYAESKIGNPTLLKLARSAGILLIDGETVRFTHQLMLEYFAAVGVSPVRFQQLLASVDINNPRFDPEMDRWGTLIQVKLSLVDNPEDFVENVAAVNPFVAANCISTGIPISDGLINQVINKVIKHISSSNSICGYLAVESLGKIGNRSHIPLLQEVFPEMPGVVAAAIVRIGEPTSASFLAKALQKPYIYEEWSYKRDIVNALGELGNPEVDVMEALVDIAIRDQRGWIRGLAINAIRKIADDTVRQQCCLQLGENDSINLIYAAKLLGILRFQEAVPLLVPLLGDLRTVYNSSESPFGPYFDCVSDVAANALAAIGSVEAIRTLNAWSANRIPTLLKNLTNPNEEIRSACLHSLINFDILDLIRDSRTLLTDEDSNIRYMTVYLLTKHLLRKRATAILIKSLSDNGRCNWFPNRVCDVAAEGLEKIGRSDALEAVRHWREEQDDSS